MFGMLTMTIQHKGTGKENLTTNTGIHTAFFPDIQQIEPSEMMWEGDRHKMFEFYCVILQRN